MSTRVLGAVWPLQMPPTAKAVLVSMADIADDDGACHPTVRNLCGRTCLSERAVQEGMGWLERHGAVRREARPGRSNRYIVTPDAYRASEATPAAGAPPQQAHPRATRTPTPAAGAPAPAAGAPLLRHLHEKTQKEEGAPDGSRSDRGTRIPDGFPSAEAIEWCRQERPDLAVGDIVAKFRDYWVGVPGARGRKCDWPATWRNFVRSERNGPYAAPRDTAADRWLQQLNRISEEDRHVDARAPLLGR